MGVGIAAAVFAAEGLIRLAELGANICRAAIFIFLAAAVAAWATDQTVDLAAGVFGFGGFVCAVLGGRAAASSTGTIAFGALHDTLA